MDLPYVVIKRWVGGLGNNLIQLYHSIYLALKLLKAGVKYPDHDLLIGNCLPLRLSAYMAGDIVGDFFQLKEVEQLLDSTHLPPNPDKLSVFRNYIRPLLRVTESSRLNLRYVNHLVIPTSPPPLPTMEDTLVIHVRSGDVTNGVNAHPNYMQPPLSFYKKVILSSVDTVQTRAPTLAELPTRSRVKKVKIITQDMTNPTVAALKEWMPSIEVLVGRSLQADMLEVLQASHLCYGKSWLPVTLALASENVRCIHVLDNMHTADFIPSSPTCLVWHYRLTEPYIKTGEWANTPKQRRFMLTYPEDAVEKL